MHEPCHLGVLRITKQSDLLDLIVFSGGLVTKQLLGESPECYEALPSISTACSGLLAENSHRFLENSPFYFPLKPLPGLQSGRLSYLSFGFDKSYFGGHKLNLPETSSSGTSSLLRGRMKPIYSLGPGIILKRNTGTFSGSKMESQGVLV